MKLQEKIKIEIGKYIVARIAYYRQTADRGAVTKAYYDACTKYEISYPTAQRYYQYYLQH